MFSNVRENTLNPLASSEVFNAADPSAAIAALFLALILSLKNLATPAQLGTGGRMTASMNNLFYDVGTLLQFDKFNNGLTNTQIEPILEMTAKYAAISLGLAYQHRQNRLADAPLEDKENDDGNSKTDYQTFTSMKKRGN